MATLALSQEIATYGFNVPCRRFLVTSNITRDRRLPIADEFVLRVLRLAGRLGATRLGAYFGYSSPETATLLLDLATRGLVTLLGDDVELAPSSYEMFRASPDDYPRIVDLEIWADRIWFDLVSRNMMAPERTRPLDHLIDLKPTAQANSMPADFARAAFEDNFREFLRKVRKINNPDEFALYSVSDATPDRFGMVVSSGAMDLELDPQPRVVPRLLKVEIDETARFRPLNDAMHDAVRRLTNPEPSQAGLADLRRLTGDTTVQAHHDRAGHFQLTAWLAAHAAAQPNRRAVFGASTLPRNRDALLQQIARHATERSKAAGTTRSLQLLWFRPVGTGWGATTDLQLALGEILGQVKQQLSPKAEVRSTIVAPASARAETTRRFGRLFERGLVSSAGHLSGGIEVLYLRGVVALVATQVALSPSVDIPVGFVFSGAPDLQRLEHALRLSSLAADHETLWRREPIEPVQDDLVPEAI